MAIEFDCIACGRRVKAPDNLAGKKARCPQCQAIIDVPDQVFEAEEVPTALTPTPPSPAFAFDQPQVDPETGEEARRPCPMCGEMIVTSAVKCRFCGEIFDPMLRKKSAAAKDDEDMSGGDWFVALLCSGLGCIIGIVWMIQGKSKGLKMFGISIGMVIFWNILRAMIELNLKR